MMLNLTTNMRIQLQNNRSAEVFYNQLLKFGNGKLLVGMIARRVSLPDNCCNLMTSIEERVEKVFLNIQNQF